MGNQVAAICNGLDPKLFDVGLIFNARDGKPDAYRQKAAGAARAFHVPELTREINPAKDLKALARLKEIFKTEKPDVVHLHSSKAGFLGRLAARSMSSSSDITSVVGSPRSAAAIRARES